MIILTKLDQSPLLINYESIKYAESIPDTRIVFTNGDSVIVRESLADLENKVVSQKADILRLSQTLASASAKAMEPQHETTHT